MMHRRRVTEEMGGWCHYRKLLRTTPDVELWRRAQKAGYAFTFVPRLTAIKFPAGHRRDVYATRPCHEQAAWLARIEAEPDFEARQLVSFITGEAVPTGMPYRELLWNVARQTTALFRIRLAGVAPWFRFRQRTSIDEIRRFKGLK